MNVARLIRNFPLCLCWIVAGCAVAPADLVFTGGAVYTVDSDQPWAEAVAVRGGRIAYVGDDAGVQPLVGEGTRVMELDGRMLLPGFHDSHMHPMAAGTRFFRCQLKGLEWPDAVMAELKRCHDGLLEGEWLRGVGLPEELFGSGVLDRKLLDSVAPGRPALISNSSGFKAWVNSSALDLAGFNAESDDREDVVRYPDSRQPTGELLQPASGLMWRLAPLPSQDRLRESLKMASAMGNGFGITSANEARVSRELLDAYIAADAAGEMTIRVQGSQWWDPLKDHSQVEDMVSNRQRAAGNRFKADAAKLFLDGDIQHGTAWLLSPYLHSGETGGWRIPPDRVRKGVARLDAEGFQVHIHAVGDAAIRLGLDSLENAAAVNPPSDRRHQIAHLAMIHPDDRGRFEQLGVAADFQPLWAKMDAQAREELLGMLGPERSRWYAAIRSIMDSGARVVAGSDWISESMNPLDAIQVAITRQPLDGSAPSFNQEQAVTLEQMLAAYTINGAWLARQEDLTGSIEVGKLADLVVLDRNLFGVPAAEISQVLVLLTLLEGVEVYRSPDSSKYSW